MATIKLTNRIATFCFKVNKGNPNPPKRGKVKGFSKSSYNRLRKLLFSIQDNPTLFITLTYPSVFPDPKSSKEHLHSFKDLFAKKFPEAFGIWKLEPQKRGAPHYHLVIYGLHLKSKREFLGFKNWLSQAWYRIVKSGDKKHLSAGTQVINLEYIQEKKGQDLDILNLYVSKYVSKEVHFSWWDFPGRYWGCINRKLLKSKIAETYNITVTDSFFYRVRRVLRLKMRSIYRNRFRFKGFKYNLTMVFKSHNYFMDFLINMMRLFFDDVGNGIIINNYLITDCKILV
ncbi:hypothetical protein JCM13304A_24800 [Desulfothermus okinawensis JCM 13304]